MNLPDEYEYEEDAVYLAELEKERRNNLGFLDRQKEDGILSGPLSQNDTSSV